MSVDTSCRFQALLVALVSTACELDVGPFDLNPPSPPPPCRPTVTVVSVALAPAVDTVEVGRGVRLKVRAKDRSGREINDVNAVCPGTASRDPAVARAEIAPFGFTPGFQVFVAGVSVGTTTVSVVVAGKTASARITVVPVRDGFVAATSGCALTPAGLAYCWGDGNPVPTRVRGGIRFASLSGWSADPCGIGTDGSAYCWGARLASDTPVSVGAGMTFRSISVGTVDICGVASAGSAYCWAPSMVGGASSVPQVVPGLITLDTVVVGQPELSMHAHACGLAASGAAYCWGDNTWGQLGSGTQSTAIPTPVLGGLKFTSLTAGAMFTCGLTQDSLAYCWGSDGGGQLGDSGSVTITTCGTEYLFCSRMPVRVAGGLRFAALAAGPTYACGLVSSGAAYCWGPAGTLGRGGDYAACEAATCDSPGSVVGGHAFRSIAAAHTHICAVSDASIVYCWGSWVLPTVTDVPIRMPGQP